MTVVDEQAKPEVRLTDSELTSIGSRLYANMNDDGLRAWYHRDVTSLLNELLILRRERARAVTILANNPPLHDVPADASVVDLAEQLVAVWQDHENGLWRRAEFARARKKISDVEVENGNLISQSTRLSTRITALESELDLLRSQLMDASKTLGIDKTQSDLQAQRVAVLEHEREKALAEKAQIKAEASQAVAATRADAARRIEAISKDLHAAKTEIIEVRDGASQAMNETQRSYIEKANAARRLLGEAMRLFENTT